MNNSNLSPYIQHTLLKITATNKDIINLCQEGVENAFQAVVVQPMWADLAVKELSKHDIAVCSVADFPHGAATLEAKRAEIIRQVEAGVDEIDVVCKIGFLRSGMLTEFYNDLATVVDNAQGKITKVILETSILTRSELAQAIEIAIDAGMDYIKTASGFNGPGATIPIIHEMHDLANGRIKIKAAGGVRTEADAIAMIEAGADCIGTSSGIAIVTGSISSSTY